MLKDLAWALRWLVKNPWFALAVTLILALGTGANTAVFSVVDALLLQPPPYDSTRLVRIEETSAQRIMNGVPAADYLEWSQRHDLFETSVPFAKDFVTLTGAGEPDQIIAMRTAPKLFAILGVHARLGRTLMESDDDPRSPHVAVLSDRFWRRQFQADPKVIGKTMALSDVLYTIVGVMPSGFEFAAPNYDVWTPLRLTPATVTSLQVAARILPGVSVEQVQSAMRIVATQFAQRDPQRKAGLQITVSPWRETLQREYELTLVFVLAAVGLVLLIACADVGGLLLTRAVQRQKEIAIRTSLGAGFWHILRQILAESLVLAALGSVAGLAVGYYTLQFLSRQLEALPIAIPFMQRVTLNERVLLFNLAVCGLLAIIMSVAPILLASKTDLQPVLRGGHAGGSRRSARLFSILIATETAFAFMLLVGSGLMVRSLIRLQQADHGFHPDHVLTMRVPLGTRTQARPSGKYDTKPRQMAYYRELIDRLQGTPGIRSIAVVNNLPLSGVNTTVPVRGPDGLPMLTVTRTISPQYFSVMGIPLVAGRFFNDSDGPAAPAVAIINEYLAHQLFPDRNPVGQPLPSSESGAPPTYVVGVVKDASQHSYEQPAKGEQYRPYQQFIFGVFMSTLVARTNGDPLAVATTLRKQIWEVEPNQPIVKVETMDNIIAESIWRPRFSAWVFSMLGAVAVALTFAGVYSIVAYTTNLRAREVGIRMALGATPVNVVSVVLRDVMIPLAAGLVISLIGSLLLARLFASLLYELKITDPITYVGAGVLLLAIGAAAGFRPAWRAATRDPLGALRAE